MQTRDFDRKAAAALCTGGAVSAVTTYAFAFKRMADNEPLSPTIALFLTPLFVAALGYLGVEVTSYLKHRSAVAAESEPTAQAPGERLASACLHWNQVKLNGHGVKAVTDRIRDFDLATKRSLSERELIDAITGLISSGAALTSDGDSMHHIAETLRILIERGRCSVGHVKTALRSAVDAAPTDLEPASATKSEFVSRLVEFMCKRFPGRETQV